MNEAIQRLISIKNTSGRNDKLEILIAAINDFPAFIPAWYAVAFDPRISTYITALPKPTVEFGIHFEDYTLDKIIGHFVSGGGRFTREQWQAYSNDLASCYTEEEYDIINQILAQDLTIGTTEGSFNRALKLSEHCTTMDPIYSYDTMRVSNIEDAEINPEGSYCGIKDDGANATAHDGGCVSRNGNKIPLAHLEEPLALIKNHWVLMGELVSTDRQSSNGLVNAAIAKGLDTDREVGNLQLRVFDCLPRKQYDLLYNPHVEHTCDVGFAARIAQAKRVVDELDHPSIVMIEQHIVNSVSEVYALCDEFIEREEEGIIWNDKDAPFIVGRSKKRARIKEIMNADFKIVGYNEHKRGGMLGSFQFETSCGTLASSTGSGLSDEQRVYFWENRPKYLDRIIKVKYNGVVPDATREGYFSLFLPVLDTEDMIRHDKKVADDIRDIEWGKKDKPKKKWLKSIGEL